MNLNLKLAISLTLVGLSSCDKNNAEFAQLVRAIHHGDGSKISDFTDSGGDPNLKSVLRSNPKSEKTLLHWAVEYGQTDIVKILLDAGASPNSRNYSGQTPLMVAFSSAKRERHEIIMLLFPITDLNLRDDGGWTVLHSATEYGTLAELKLVLKHIDLSLHRDGVSPLRLTSDPEKKVLLNAIFKDDKASASR